MLVRTVAALSVVAAVSVPVAAAEDECGGDNPRWILVTVKEASLHAPGAPGTNALGLKATLDYGKMFIKVCEIASVTLAERVMLQAGVPPLDEAGIDDASIIAARGASSTHIYRVEETPEQICAAMPTCSDASDFNELARHAEAR